MKIIDVYNSTNRENNPMLLIEDVLDTLTEVGNGVTDKHLHEAADKLFKARDLLDKIELPPPQYNFPMGDFGTQDTAVIYRPYCEKCGHRLTEIEVMLSANMPKLYAKQYGTHIRFNPPTCPRCGRLFTSAQVPLRYSERSE